MKKKKTMTITKVKKPKSTKNDYKKGFGSMNKNKQKEIARKGGIMAHKKGTAHEWTSAETKAAGKKRWKD